MSLVPQESTARTTRYLWSFFRRYRYWGCDTSIEHFILNLQLNGEKTYFKIGHVSYRTHRSTRVFDRTKRYPLYTVYCLRKMILCKRLFCNCQKENVVRVTIFWNFQTFGHFSTWFTARCTIFTMVHRDLKEKRRYIFTLILFFKCIVRWIWLILFRAIPCTWMQATRYTTNFEFLLQVYMMYERVRA